MKKNKKKAAPRSATWTRWSRLYCDAHFKVKELRATPRRYYKLSRHVGHLKCAGRRAPHNKKKKQKTTTNCGIKILI